MGGGLWAGASDLIRHWAGFPWQAAGPHCPAPTLGSQAGPTTASKEQGPSIPPPWPGLPLSCRSLSHVCSPLLDTSSWIPGPDRGSW